MRRILAFAVASAICSVSAGAQAPAVVGKWNAEWELGRMVQNGEVSAIRANGVITVEASGDSLLATIQVTKRSDDRPLPPNVVTLGGRMSARGATFVQKQTVRLNMNGEEQSREITVTWTLNAEGNKLNGSMAREMPFVSEAPAPSEITGTRIP